MFSPVPGIIQNGIMGIFVERDTDDIPIEIQRSIKIRYAQRNECQSIQRHLMTTPNAPVQRRAAQRTVRRCRFLGCAAPT